MTLLQSLWSFANLDLTLLCFSLMKGFLLALHDWNSLFPNILAAHFTPAVIFLFQVTWYHPCHRHCWVTFEWVGSPPGHLCWSVALLSLMSAVWLCSYEPSLCSFRGWKQPDTHCMPFNFSFRLFQKILFDSKHCLCLLAGPVARGYIRFGSGDHLISVSLSRIRCACVQRTLEWNVATHVEI